MEAYFWDSIKPSPSGTREFLPNLLREQEIIWKMPMEEIVKFRWVREWDASWFEHTDLKKAKNVVAYTVDWQGYPIRVWTRKASDDVEYAGWDNCPIEAIYPLSIELGQPTFPSLPTVKNLKHRKA